MNKTIQQFLIQQGADTVRFADISALPERQTQGYKKAVVFCLALTKKFILDVRGGLVIDEQNDEFVQKEKRADEIAEQLADFIRNKGYNAYPQSEKGNAESGHYDEATATSTLPHKTIARLAGLGFIGKSDLFVTEKYGSAFSMCTVLTDAPVEIENKPLIQPKCGACDLCVKACPAGAIHGREWTESGGRESIVDVTKCFCALKCMVACPWTLRYAKNRIIGLPAQ